MNPLIEYLKQTVGTVFTNEDGDKTDFKLLPPLTDMELALIVKTIPCPLPKDIRELLKFARGFDGTWLEEVQFADSSGLGFGLEEIFPHAFVLAHDGLGNSWLVDLTMDSQSWGPIFYACHDAPVIVFQTNSLLHFIEEVVKNGNRPWKGEIDEVWGSLSDHIWKNNPGVLTFAHCIESSDPEIMSFAAFLDDTWEFIDLRNASLGDGFSWGRYGAKTVVRRFGEKRIFAYQKKSLGRRLLDAFR